MKRDLTIGIILLVIGGKFLAAQTAEEIIDKMETLSSPETAETVGRMVTTDRFGSKETPFKSYAQGEDRSLIVFTGIEEDGQKILRVEDDLYVYFPDARRTIRMQGGALRDAVMGSDFSYEDMTTGSRGLLEDYQRENFEISAGLSHTHYFEGGVRLGFRLEGLVRPWREWTSVAGASVDEPPYALFLYSEVSLRGSSTALVLNALYSPVDFSALVSLLGRWKAFQGLTLLGAVSLQGGESSDIFNGKRSSLWGLTLGAEYVF